MARKFMTREVTKTTVKVAKMEIEEGVPKAVTLPDMTLIGNIKIERAQRIVEKEYGKGATVLEVHPETKVYELAVEKFLEVATIKETEETDEQ